MYFVSITLMCNSLSICIISLQRYVFLIKLQIKAKQKDKQNAKYLINNQKDKGKHGVCDSKLAFNVLSLLKFKCEMRDRKAGRLCRNLGWR